MMVVVPDGVAESAIRGWWWWAKANKKIEREVTLRPSSLFGVLRRDLDKVLFNIDVKYGLVVSLFLTPTADCKIHLSNFTITLLYLKFCIDAVML